MSEVADRGAMTSARKRRIWVMRNGRCYHCGGPTDVSGPNVIYDHKRALGLLGSDDDSNIWPVHKWCDEPKTADDKKRIAHARRQSKLVEPREKSKHPIRNRGFAKGKRKLQSRSTFRRRPRED